MDPPNNLNTCKESNTYSFIFIGIKNTDNIEQRSTMAQKLETKEQMYRRQRLICPLTPAIKSTANCGVYMSPFIQKYHKRNPNWMYKRDFTSELARGLIKEGRLSHEQVEIVNQLHKLFLEEVKKKSVYLYTMPSSFYQHLNSILHHNDLSKIDNYGPFCCALHNFLGENETDMDEEPICVLYRGANLEPEHLDEYKRNIGKVRSWLAFSSTSTKEDVADIYSSNSLFIICPAITATPFFPGRLIKEISFFHEENEVLLQPGVDFRIEEVNQSTEQEKKHIIRLTLL
jgi:hypothetical protein